MAELTEEGERYMFQILKGAVVACSPSSSVLAMSIINQLQSEYLANEITEKDFNDQFSSVMDEVNKFVNYCDCRRKKRI